MHSSDHNPAPGPRIDSPIAATADLVQPGLSSAIDNAMDSSSSSSIHPDLVAKIKREVLEALKAEGVTAASTQLPTPAASQALPDRAATSVTAQQAPQLPRQPSYADRSQVPLHHPQPTATLRKPAEPRSPISVASSHLPPRYTPPSSDRDDAFSHGSSSPEPQMSEPGSSYMRGSRRDSRSSQSGQEDAGSRQRPRPVRIPSSVEETSIEKAWQPLFDNGKPTLRLSQFLRGVARHIIDDCKPRNSIVVTPGKLSDFFSVTKQANEMYPWKKVFGGSLTNVAISSIFMQLGLQHHLVQFKSTDNPTIPGLTPQGFETLMIMVISAYPDQEFQRLDKAVRLMPISNADSPTERFPKELSRRLFPISGDYKFQQRLNAALTSVNMPARSINNIPPPPAPQGQPGSAPSSQAFFGERGGDSDRNNHQNANTSAIDDDDIRVPSGSFFPVERERKPYTAREGTGKVYGDSRSVPSGTGTRSNRSSSVLPTVSARPTDIPPSSSRTNRLSMNIGIRPDMRYSTSTGTAPAHPYTRSEGTNVNSIPDAYYASNMDQDDYVRDPRRTFRRQQTEEDGSRSYTRSAYESSSQQPPAQRPHANSDTYGNYPGYPPPLPSGPRY